MQVVKEEKAEEPEGDGGEHDKGGEGGKEAAGEKESRKEFLHNFGQQTDSIPQVGSFFFT